MRILLLITREILQEICGAGLGDGSEMRDHVVAVHADAVVFERNGLGVLVEAEANLQVRTTFKQLRIGQRFETQFVGCIGGIGNQLPQEDFLVGIQRMNHQVKQLLHFGLEAQGFFLSLHTHRLLTPHQRNGTDRDCGDVWQMGARP